MANNPPGSKKQRREAARERIREERRRQLAREARAKKIKLATMIGVPVLVLAVIVGMVFLLQPEPKPDSGAAPAGASEQGGLVLQSPATFLPGDLEQVDLTQLPEPADFDTVGAVPPGSEGGDGAATVVIYSDANCVHCAEFDKQHRDLLQNSLDNRDITLEYRMVDYLDYASPDNYSTRAAAAAACVADQNPAAYLPFLSSLYDVYGTEQTDEQLVQLADAAGADISGCVEEDTFKPFVEYTSAHARGVPVTGTPSVWINGKAWNESGLDFPRFLAQEVTAE